MSSIAVVMLTMDRTPRKNYLAETLGNLKRAGFFESKVPHTFHLIDSGSPDPAEFVGKAFGENHIPGSKATLHTAPNGKRVANANATAALRTGAETGADWVLFIEDDIDVVDGFLDGVAAWLDKHAQEEYRLYSFGAAYTGVRVAHAEGREVWPYPIKAFYGTQAFAVRREDALDAADTLDEIQKTWDTGQGYDLQLKLWAKQRYPEIEHFLASAPSFVQHTGVESALHYGRFHTYASWPGPQWRYAGQPPTTKLKVLWVGDVVQQTGFQRVTQNVLNYLHPLWDVTVLGINYNGDPHSLPYPVYPAHLGGDSMGVGRLRAVVEYIQPDVVMILQDPWIVTEFLKEMVNIPVPVVAYMPVDGKNMMKATELNGLGRAVWYTKFGQTEAEEGGYTGPSDVIPHGVDTSIYVPGDREDARRYLGLTKAIGEGAFLVGNINRNQPRKRLDLTVEVFAKWWKQAGSPVNAYLFLHCSRFDTGYDVVQLSRYYGIPKNLILSKSRLGTGDAVSESDLVRMYQAMDVMMSTTQGEGWGLTTHEGMACGIPQILPDWAALGEWTRGASELVPVDSLTVTPKGINVVGATPSVAGMVEAIHRAYTSAEWRTTFGQVAHVRATEPRFCWPNVGARFDRVLREVISEHEAKYWNEQTANVGVDEGSEATQTEVAVT